MSDTRREISQKYLSCGGKFVPGDVEGRMQAAMSEYAAAVLEDVAFNLWRNGAEPIKSANTKRAQDRRYALDALRARAAQERGR